MPEKKRFIVGKRKSMLIAIIASLLVIVVGSVAVTYGWFLSRGSSEYGFVLKADDHVILQYETDLNFANNGTSADDENCLVPAVAELTFGLDQREYEPIDMFDPSAVETVATAAHFHTKAAYWTGSSVDKGELSLKVSATVKGGSSAYDLVEWGEIDYIAIFSYLWDGTDATKKVLYYDGEWYSDIETAASPFIVPLSVTGNQALTTWYVLDDTEKVKVSNSIKYLLMSPNREFEFDLYAFVAKTDELLDPAINGQTISLSATINDMTAFVDLGDNTIKFGSYPQSLVVNTQIQRKLNDLAGALPTNGASGNWTSYKYYIASSNATDFMWYIDVVLRGEKFRGVYFNQYRPDYFIYKGTADHSNQDENGYLPNTVYWFKFESIRWRVLSENQETGQKILLCEKILDHRAAYTGQSDRTIEGESVHPNNYEYSELRKWLNEDFYDTAFDDLQKIAVQTATVDNSARSTNPDANANWYGGGANKNACANTVDKIFLLSLQEATRVSYGFSYDPNTKDPARVKQATDYAKAQGIPVNSAGEGRWRFRSPKLDGIVATWSASNVGDCQGYHEAFIAHGVVPACVFKSN